MGTYIIRDVQDFLIERWGQKQMRSDVDLQLAAHAKQVRLENAQLREQNRVLRELVQDVMNSGVTFEDGRIAYKEVQVDRTWFDDAKAALTAMSQEGQHEAAN